MSAAEGVDAVVCMVWPCGAGLLVQVMSFPVNCNECAAPGETRMCVTDIPHFKEIIIMSFLCDDCGARTVEVKGGGAVPDHGTRTTLKVTPGTAQHSARESACVHAAQA